MNKWILIALMLLPTAALAQDTTKVERGLYIVAPFGWTAHEGHVYTSLGVASSVNYGRFMLTVGVDFLRGPPKRGYYSMPRSGQSGDTPTPGAPRVCYSKETGEEVAPASCAWGSRGQDLNIDARVRAYSVLWVGGTWHSKTPASAGWFSPGITLVANAGPVWRSQMYTFRWDLEVNPAGPKFFVAMHLQVGFRVGW